jgi:hypothetical protein
VSLADYLTGLAFFAITGGAAVATALLVTGRRLPQLTGAPRALAVGLIATAALIAVSLFPGLVGVLSRLTTLATALLLLAAASRLPRVAGEPEPQPEPSAGSGPLSWAIAGLAGGLVAVCTGVRAWKDSALPSTDIDTLTFHLPNVAGWIESGSFWRLDQFNPLLANGDYPNNGDVVFLALVQAFENDAFVRLLNLPWLALAALSVYAIARELRAPRATSVLLGAVFASLPVVTLAVHDGAKTDPILMAAFGTGCLFLLRHFRNGRTSELVLAGLALGIAFGTKWYGISTVVVVLAVWVASSLLARRSLGLVAQQGAALAALVAAGGGFWLVRNLVESGNPLFPVKVQVLGATIFDAPRDFIRECSGFRLVDYLGSPGIWSDYVRPAFEENYALPGLLLLVGFLATVALAGLAWRRGERRAAGAVLAVTAGALLVALAYGVTPYSAFGPEDQPILVGANARWLTPGLLLAAVASAWAIGRAGRLRPLAELLALVAVVDGARRGFGVSRTEVLAVGAAAAAAAACGYALFALTRPLPRRARVAAWAAMGALLAGVLVAAGHERQRDFNEGRYMGADPTIDRMLEIAPEGHRIGLAGVWGTRPAISPVWPAFGPRLGNHVGFVGEFVDGLLREYETREEWAAALRGGRYDLLLVGRGGYGRACRVPGEETDDDAWARAEGLVPVARSESLTLYMVPGARSRRLTPGRLAAAIGRSGHAGPRAITPMRSRKSGAHSRSASPTAAAPSTRRRARPGE